MHWGKKGYLLRNGTGYRIQASGSYCCGVDKDDYRIRVFKRGPRFCGVNRKFFKGVELRDFPKMSLKE